MLKRVKRVLRERVDEVRFSARLSESAACLVIGEEDLGYQMRELLKVAGHEAPETRPSLELNPRHPLVKQLGRERDEAPVRAPRAGAVSIRPLSRKAASSTTRPHSSSASTSCSSEGDPEIQDDSRAAAASDGAGPASAELTHDEVAARASARALRTPSSTRIASPAAGSAP